MNVWWFMRGTGHARAEHASNIYGIAPSLAEKYT